MVKDQSDYDFLVSEYGKNLNRIRDLEALNRLLNDMLNRAFDYIDELENRK